MGEREHRVLPHARAERRRHRLEHRPVRLVDAPEVQAVDVQHRVDRAPLDELGHLVEGALVHVVAVEEARGVDHVEREPGGGAPDEHRAGGVRLGLGGRGWRERRQEQQRQV